MYVYIYIHIQYVYIYMGSFPPMGSFAIYGPPPTNGKMSYILEVCPHTGTLHIHRNDFLMFREKSCNIEHTYTSTIILLASIDHCRRQARMQLEHLLTHSAPQVELVAVGKILTVILPPGETQQLATGRFRLRLCRRPRRVVSKHVLHEAAHHCQYRSQAANHITQQMQSCGLPIMVLNRG
jgi:hypothetical protein